MSRENQRKKCKEYIWSVLTVGMCADCGENNPLLLEFDHLPGSQKVASISQLVNRGRYSELLEEVQKCELRCANCHRLKSAMDHRYYKDFIDWDDNRVVQQYMSSIGGGA